jgi:hypothetical protein
MTSAGIVDWVKDGELKESGLLTGVDLIQVVIQRPVTWIGPSNAAASWTAVFASIVGARSLSDSRLGNDQVGQEGNGPKAKVEPRGHHSQDSPLLKLW